MSASSAAGAAQKHAKKAANADTLQACRLVEGGACVCASGAGKIAAPKRAHAKQTTTHLRREQPRQRGADGVREAVRDRVAAHEERGAGEEAGVLDGEAREARVGERGEAVDCCVVVLLLVLCCVGGGGGVVREFSSPPERRTWKQPLEQT